MAEHAVYMEEVRNAYNCLAGRQRKEDSVMRPRRQSSNVKIDYRRIMCVIVDWIQLCQDVILLRWSNFETTDKNP